jgi:hypothetical protein
MAVRSTPRINAPVCKSRAGVPSSPDHSAGTPHKRGQGPTCPRPVLFPLLVVGAFHLSYSQLRPI